VSSLRSRLGTGLVLNLLLMLGVLLLITHTSVSDLVEEQVASRLEHDGETLLGGLGIHSDGSVALDARRIQGIYLQPFSGHYFIIRVGEQTVRSRSLWDETLAVPEVATGETRVGYATGPQQQELLMWTRAFRKAGQDVSVTLAEDLVTARQGAARFRVRLLAWALALVLLLFLLQQYIVARTLRPVAQAAEDVARLEQGEIQALCETVPDEVSPLVCAINKLLQRQQQRLQRSREALGNLAHSIKTPLTLLQQTAGDKLPADDASAREQLDRYSREINERIDKALRRARIAGDSLGTSRFDLRQDLPALVDTVQRLHNTKQVTFEQNLGGLTQLPLEQQDGMELLGNLLDNAWKWSRNNVRLSLENTTPLIIRVEDDGQGVDDAKLQSLAQRGVRQDEATPGHGIGLSIVNSLVEELGGAVRFGSSPTLGGLQVEIQLQPHE
jgi:signal transduction histidine kinase